MCCAGFPSAFGLPSTATAQGNQPVNRELRAVLCAQALELSVRNAGEKRLAAGGCLQACTGKDRVSFHTGGDPALHTGAIAQSPAERLLCAGRAYPSPAQLLEFAPGKEQVAGVCET